MPIYTTLFGIGTKAARLVPSFFNFFRLFLVNRRASKLFPTIAGWLLAGHWKLNETGKPKGFKAHHAKFLSDNRTVFVYANGPEPESMDEPAFTIDLDDIADDQFTLEERVKGVSYTYLITEALEKGFRNEAHQIIWDAVYGRFDSSLKRFGRLKPYIEPPREKTTRTTKIGQAVITVTC